VTVDKTDRVLVPQAGRPPSPDRTKPVEIRTCRRHGEVEFGLYGRASPQWKCKRCVAERVTRRNQKVKRILVAEHGGCCAVCGYDRSIVNLHFHHVDPAQKTFPLATGSGKSLAAYREEARKCVLVCANCHGEIESRLIESPPAGSTYWERVRCEPPPRWFADVLGLEAVGRDASPPETPLTRAQRLAPD
jgi:hypothetical protein